MKRSSDSLARSTVCGSFAALFAWICSASVALAAVSLIGLATLGGTCNGTTAVSWDGSVVVGWIGDFVPTSDPLYPASLEAARWTYAGDPEVLGMLPGHVRSAATDVSADGQVVVGVSGKVISSGGPNEGFRWSEGSGMVALGFLPGDTWSAAMAASADGGVVVGVSGEDPYVGVEPFRWSQTAGMIGLGFLPGDDRAEVRDVSADGSVVVGHSTNQGASPLVWEAFRWTEGGGMASVASAPPGGGSSRAYATSADGSIVVGSQGDFAFRRQFGGGGGLLLLDPLPSTSSCAAHGVSPDGRVIAGICSVLGGGQAVFRWDEHYGMRDVATLLADLGLDLSVWESLAFFAYPRPSLSLDGRFMTGTGDVSVEALDSRPWLAEIPSCYDGLDNDGDGLVDHPNDPDCASLGDDAERIPACGDGQDNDGDGETDFPQDAGCSSGTSALESPACDNGLDDDGDGRIDFTPPNGFLADPQCTAAWKNREAKRRGACGLLGLEALPFVIAFSLRARRRCA